MPRKTFPEIPVPGFCGAREVFKNQGYSLEWLAWAPLGLNKQWIKRILQIWASDEYTCPINGPKVTNPPKGEPLFINMGFVYAGLLCFHLMARTPCPKPITFLFLSGPKFTVKDVEPNRSQVQSSPLKLHCVCSRLRGVETILDTSMKFTAWPPTGV